MRQRTVRVTTVFVAGLVTALSPLLAHADPQMTLVLQAETVAPGEGVALTLTIADAPEGQLTMPSFGALKVRGPRQSESTSIEIRNGTTNVRKLRVFTWMVSAEKPGKYTIGAAVLHTADETFKTDEAVLTVATEAAPPTTAEDEEEPDIDRPRRNPFAAPPTPFPDDPFDIFEEFERWGAGSDPWRKPSEGDVFLRAIVDKPQAWLGEQVTLTLYLFAQVDVSQVQAVAFPKLDGFWAEDLETPTQLTPELRTLKGVTYRAYMLRRRALFPLRSGELVIDPVESAISIGQRMFWGAPPEVVKRRSTAISVKVRELPAEGQPTGFDVGNVGAWRVSSTLTPTETSLGNPVTLRMTIEGAGNVKNLRVPKLQLPVGLKAYDPTITDKVKVTGTRFGGTKVAEWVIVPERTGSFEVPGVQWPVFLPVEGVYDTLTTEPVQLLVEGPANAPLPDATTPIAAPVAANVLSGGIRPIRMTADLSLVSPEPAWRRGWFWVLVFGPVGAWTLAAAGGGVAGLLRTKDDEASREKRAKGAAAKRLKKARELLDQGDADGLYVEITRSMHAFLADKHRIPAQGLVRTQLVETLVSKGIPDETARLCAQVLETCETARYAPGSKDKFEMERVLEAARKVIDEIDATKGGVA